MGQDKDTGAAADRYSRTTARTIAARLGATMQNANSNECMLGGARGVIKCARQNTPSIGVTEKMLDRIQFVVAALEVDDSTYELYRLPAERFRAHMRPSASRGPSSGQVSRVSKPVFREEGARLRDLRL